MRAANSMILVEQSMGRGLRLPFNDRTDNKLLDQLNIIFHDKFNELVKKLVQQVITYISSYSKDHSETEWIINYYQKEISEKIYQQIMKNLIKPSIKREIKIKGEIQTSSIPYYLTAQKGLKDINYKTIIEKKREIQNIVFSGFQKCCYQLQKFDSNPEKEFCEILEDSKEIISWLRINWDIGIKLNIKYEDPVTHNMKLYIPDFIIESKDYKYILEIKAKKDIFDLDVQSKKEAAERWCDFATTFEKRDEHYKSWRYILITDDLIKLDTTFSYIIEK